MAEVFIGIKKLGRKKRTAATIGTGRSRNIFIRIQYSTCYFSCCVKLRAQFNGLPKWTFDLAILANFLPLILILADLEQ